MARLNGKDRGIYEYPKGSDQWWVRIAVNGRMKKFKAGTKPQAKSLCIRLKADILEGKYAPKKFKKKVIRFSELAKERIVYADIHHKRSGDDTPRVQRWTDAFGNMDASTITPSKIEQVLLDMKKEGYAPATIARYLVVIKAIFNRANRDELLTVNPAAKVAPPKINNVLVRYLTVTQEEKLLRELPERFCPIVLTALHTGMRQGELLRLTWQDVDWNTGILTINESKSGERRRVPMNSTVQAVLSDLRVTRADSLIFSHDARYLRRAFSRAVQEAGLDPFRFHDLRHTFASRLAMQGVNDRTLQALGGWKSPRMLTRYAHLSPTHLWQAVEGLSKENQGATAPETAPAKNRQKNKPALLD